MGPSLAGSWLREIAGCAATNAFIAARSGRLPCANSRYRPLALESNDPAIVLDPFYCSPLRRVRQRRPSNFATTKQFSPASPPSAPSSTPRAMTDCKTEVRTLPTPALPLNHFRACGNSRAPPDWGFWLRGWPRAFVQRSSRSSGRLPA